MKKILKKFRMSAELFLAYSPAEKNADLQKVYKAILQTDYKPLFATSVNLDSPWSFLCCINSFLYPILHEPEPKHLLAANQTLQYFKDTAV